jgi:hypothetical protein
MEYCLTHYSIVHYASAKLPARPVPNAKVIEAYIEELLLRKSDAPRDVNLYLDASLF